MRRAVFGLGLGFVFGAVSVLMAEQRLERTEPDLTALPGYPLGLGYVKGEWWLLVSRLKELPTIYASQEGRKWRPVWRGFLFGGVTERVYLFEDEAGRAWAWRMTPSFTLPGEWPPKKEEEFRVDLALLSQEQGFEGKAGFSFQTPPRLVVFDRFRRLYVLMSSERVLLSPMAPVLKREMLKLIVRSKNGKAYPFPFFWFVPDSYEVNFSFFSQRPPNPCLVMEGGILLADRNRVYSSSDWIHWEGPRYLRTQAERAEAFLRLQGEKVALLLSSHPYFFICVSEEGGETWDEAHLVPLPRVMPLEREPLVAQGEESILVLLWKIGPGKDEESYTFLGKPILVDKGALNDSDGDGLTDWEEEFFLTNSRKPDTDGDGISDKGDQFPRALGRLPKTDEEGILQAIFPSLPIFPSPPRLKEPLMVAIIVNRLEDGIHMPIPEEIRKPIRTKFIHMTKEELEPHFKRFPSQFRGVELSEVYFDPTDTKAVADVIIWSRPRVGERVSFKLVKQEGKWVKKQSIPDLAVKGEGGGFLPESGEGRRWEAHLRLFGCMPLLAGLGPKGAFVALAALFSPFADGDSDGLFDLYEEVLSLNLQNPDTDGDGKPDGEDRFPNAPPKPPRTDEEEIFQIVLQILARDFPQVLGGDFFLLQASSFFFVWRPKEEWREFPLPKEPKFKVIYRWGEKRPIFLYPTISIGPIYFNQGRTKTFVEGGVIFGPLAGRGFELRLEKRNGKWAPVEKIKPTWIA